MGKKISFLVPCYNEEEVMPFLRKELSAFIDRLQGKGYDTEVLLIDDGSRDLTWFLISEWSGEDARIRGIRLSRNFGHQIALTCAYQQCTGDAVVSIDADLQDPLETINEMIEKWEAGADIVLGVRSKREGETRFKLFTASLYYRLLHVLGLKFIEKDCGDFRLMNRRSVSALNTMNEHGRLLRAMVSWIGFRVDRVYFERRPRIAGQTKYPFLKMLLLAINGIISFSHIPLRLAYYLGVFISSIVFIYLIYTFVMHFLGRVELVHGWSSIMAAITAFGAVNLICLGVMGEYIGRIYTESQKRPLYLIGEDTKEKAISHEQ